MSATIPATVTVAQYLADPSAITANGPVEIADTAANISNALDTLQSQLAGVSTIEISDNADVAISASQTWSDSAAIAKLSDADDLLTAQLQITDTGGAIVFRQRAIEALAEAGKLASLTVIDDEILWLTTQQVDADIAALELAHGVSGVQLTLGVSDTGADLESGFGLQMQAPPSLFNELENKDDARLQVSITDGGAATLIVFPDDTLAVQGALTKGQSVDFENFGGRDSLGTLVLDNATSVNVSGMSRGEAIVFDGLPAISGKATVAVALSLEPVINVLSVTENGADVASVQLTAAEAQLAFGYSIDGGAVEVYALPTNPTAEEYLANAAYYNAQGSPVEILDTAANIAANLSGLQADASHIGSIVLSDNGTLQLTASQALNDSATISLTQNPNAAAPVNITISDTGADISAQLDALDDMVKTLSEVTVIGDDAVVTMTAAQAQNDSALLAALQPQAGGSLTFSIADSGANLSAAMNAIEALETRAHTDLQVEVTDAGAVTLEVATGGSLTIEGALGAGQSVAFNGGGALDLDGATDVSVYGFAAYDALVFERLTPKTKGAVPSLSLDDATDVLTVSENGSSVATVQLTAQEAALPLGFVAMGASLEILALPSDPTVDEYLDNAAYYNGLGTRTSIIDTAANVEGEIDALQADSGDLASITISDNGVLTLSATQLANDGAALGLIANADDAIRLNIAVSDSDANISAHLGVIESLAGEISGVTVTGSLADDDDAVLSLTAQQSQTDIAALQLMEPPAGGTLTFAVTDTAANLSAALDAIEQLEGLPRASLVVTVSDNAALTLTASQFLADAKALASSVNANGEPLQIEIVDTAGNISDDFAALAAADSDIASITISDNAALALTPSEIANDGAAIALLQNAGGGAVNLGPFAHMIRVDDFLANIASYSAQSPAVISDTAAQISKNLDALAADAADIASLTISDDDALTLTAKDFAANAALLASTTPLNGGPLQVDIVDTAAGVQSEFDALAASSEIAAITVSDGGTVTLDALQIANDASLLTLLTTPSGAAVPVAVVDNGGDILNNLDALAASASQISAITISDSSQLLLTAAEAANDLPALALLKNANGKPAVLSVSDTAANIQANFAALQTASGDLNSIIVDDSLPLTLTAAQAADDSGALSLLKNSDGSSVAFAVSDSSDDILAHLGALKGDAAEISSLTDTNLSGADDTIFVSLASFEADGALIARIVSADPTPVAATIDIADTAATLSANIDALDDDLSTGAIAGLQQSDLGGDDDIVVTAAQFADDAKAIAALANAGAQFAIADSAGGLAAALPALASGGDLSLVNTLTVAQDAPVLLSAAEFGDDNVVSALQTLETVDAALHPSVSDTAADLSAAMDTLQGEISSLNAIYVSNNRAVTLTAAQIGADQGAIQLLQNQDDLLPLAIDVSDTAANIADDFATLASLNVNGVNPIAAISASQGGIVTLTAGDVISGARLVGEIQGASAIDVADTADDILKALPELLADIKSIGAIAITDGDDLVLSKSLQTKYASVIAKLPKNSVTTLPEISWTTYQTDVAANTVPASFAIDDTASVIEANIAALSGGLSGLAYVEVKSGALQFSATQVDDDATTLGAIQTTTGAIAGFSVTDSAAHIVKALGALETLDSQITSITVSPGGALENLTAADIADDYPVLHRIAASAEVSDSADDIVGDFAALEKDSGQISSIAVTGGGALTLSASEVEGAQATLNALYAGDESITFAVSDSGAAIAAALDALQGNLAHISSISAYDRDDAYVITAEQFAKDSGAIALIQQDDPQASFTLSDVAADIATYLGQLGAATKITISDSEPIAVTLAEVSSDSSEIAALVNQDGSPVVLDVTDTAADIANAAGSLATLPPDSQITVRDDAGAILGQAATLGQITTLVAIDASGTAAEIVADANGILAVAPNASTTHSFAVTDTAAHIEASLDALAGVKGLAAVTVSDGAPVVVDIAQLVADAPVVALIEASDPQGRPLKLVDSYSHADSTAGLAALQAAASHIASVTLTGPKPTAPFSAAAFKADQAALDDIGAAAKSLSISDTAAGILGDMSALRTDTTVTSIAVVDASADIAASFDLLDDALKVSAAAAGDNSIGGITISDNAPVTLSVAQLGDSLALARLKDANGNPYRLAIVDTSADLTNGASALKAAASHIASERVTATVAGIGTADSYFGAHKSSKLVGVEVQDNAANIEAGLSALASYVRDITIDATDAPVNVALSAFQPNESVLNDVIGGFDITDTTANLGATSTAAATALGLLQADLSHIDKLTLTGSLTGLSAATAIADAGVLSDVSGGFSVTDSAANLGSNLGKLASASDIGKLRGIDVSGDSILIVSTTTAVADEKALLKVTNGFSVKGSAAAVARDADVLEAEVDNISTIAVTGSGKLTVTAAVAARDNRAFSLAGTYAVSDTGANISSDLASLLPDAANISAISLLSGEVDVSVATLAADAALLAKIAGGVVVSDSGSNIAAALSTLASDVTSKLVRHIAISAPAGGGTAYLQTTTDNATEYAAAIGVIRAPYVLEETDGSGAIAKQIGHGTGLTFVDSGGSETLTGGGGGETFQLNAGFGAAEITDFYKYASGATHDTIVFADFANFSDLTGAAKAAGANVVITAGSDKLTLDHMTLAQLAHDKADFTFG